MRTLALTLALCLPAFAQKNAVVPDTDPEIERQSFIVAPGFEVNLFASDPMFAKPIQMNWDAQGRLWVASSETYPQIKPGAVANDKIVILEDTKGTGTADKVTVFADGLLIPTGILPGDGGVYVANSTEILHLSASKPGGKADKRRVVLSGFGTEDTHHIIHTFRWGPDGAMYFNQSIYIHSHVETPHGVKHLNAGGIWRYEPKTQKLDVFARGWVNAWGHQFDKYGNSFVTDGAGGEGINHAVPGFSYVTAFNASRIHHGLNPGSPKHCGLEIISGRHFPDDWQGDCITNDFRGHRVCRFKLRDDGSTFDSREMTEVIKTKHGAFRPIDVSIGPDGALYIADWYNPIIQHGEVDFRDDRRDHTHGRIWRVTAKGRPLVKPQDLTKLSSKELWEKLADDEALTRVWAKRLLIERDQGTTHKYNETAGFREAEETVLKKGPLAMYNALAIGLKIDPQNLHNHLQMQFSKDEAWRAAVLLNPSAVEEVEYMFNSGVKHPSPKVRLAALRGMMLYRERKGTKNSGIEEPLAALALKVLDHPMDATLDYALWLTLRELEPEWMPEFVAGKIDFGGDIRKLTFALNAVQSLDAIKPLLGILNAGKIPADKQAEVWALVARLGGPAELGEAFRHAVKPATPKPMAEAIINALADAAKSRKVKPDAKAIAEGMAALSDDTPYLQWRLKLIGPWKLESDREHLEKFTTKDEAMNWAITQALVELGGPKSQAYFVKLTQSMSEAERRRGVIALAGLNVDYAAPFAAKYLSGSSFQVDAIFNEFVNRKGGVAALAKALKDVKLPADVAKLGIRSAKGQQELINALTKAGSLGVAKKAPTPEEVKALAAEAMAKGDAVRGEAIYRRKEMQCLSCHAVAGAGGAVGPDMTSIGASAQPDYLVDSLLLPNKAIKEGYNSFDIVKTDGKLVSGIKVRETTKDITLRDKDDKEITISNDDIESKKNGKSLMPDGLTDSLTQQEFADLVKFLSVLGKVGEYEPTQTRFVRKWEIIEPTKENLEAFRRGGVIVAADPASTLSWSTAYTRVNGSLPLSEVPLFTVWKDSGPQSVLRFTLNATAAGAVKLKLDDIAGVTVYVAGKPVEAATAMTVNLDVGKHFVTLIFDRTKRTTDVTLELEDIAGSPARVTIVNGK
ncbi:L-sorbosone dehydrogenase [soil metagenome]